MTEPIQSLLATVVELPRFSVPAFFVLLMSLLGGTAVFYQLSRRWTHERPRSAVAEWAAARRFSVRWAPRAPVPVVLQRLTTQYGATAEVALKRGPLLLVRMTAPVKESVEGEAAKSAEPWTNEPAAMNAPPPPRRWHVLIRQTNWTWTAAGLRPTGERRNETAQSLVDAFDLPAFPALLWSDRFVVHAAESRAARALARAPARGLLPPDVGLMLYGPNVMLDFSDRPFDTVEFDRLLAVMEQLKDHLPAAKSDE